jgi:alpha-beta hydrolase superfamily lysophospholipase
MARLSARVLLALAAIPVALLVVAAFLLGLSHGGHLSADWGAAAILHPMKRPVTRTPDGAHEDVTITSGAERLEGWLLPATGERRGLVVYLHGIADNRQSGIGVARRLRPRGYDVLTFDGRAHGRSTGEACTYGFHERHDVSRALDAVEAGDAILFGHSLGASIALQAAAIDTRVAGVIAASPFSDLETIVRERSQWLLLPDSYVETALRRAGELGHFSPAEASPVALAPQVRVPVLVLHGEDDYKTPPDHSRRIFAALGGPRHLAILPGIAHDEILGREEAWKEIQAFFDRLEETG